MPSHTFSRSRARARRLWVWAMGCLLSTTVAQAQVQVDLSGGQEKEGPLPGLFLFDLPESLADHQAFTLQAEGLDEPLPAQRWDGRQGIVRLPEGTPLGSLGATTLRPEEGVPSRRVEVIRNESRVHMRSARAPILTYHIKTMMPPAGRPEYYRRSGFIHPFYSPSGVVLTDDFPVGHTHQHAIFMAWVNTTFHGRDVDFWNQQDQTGTVEHRRVVSTEEGPVFGRMVVEHAYVSFDGGDVLRETWTVTAFPVGEEVVVDMESVQTAAGREPLQIEAYHYGGLGFRGSAAWNGEDESRYEAPMQVLTSLGDERQASNHTRPRWTTAYGPVGGKVAGLAILDHPDNFRHPQPVRVHPEMPYFCLAPMVEGAFSIGPGDTYRSRYRLVAFDGPPDQDILDRHWQAFARP